MGFLQENIGKIVDVPATFVDGYHVDVMLNEAMDFGENELIINNPKHTFG